MTSVVTKKYRGVYHTHGKIFAHIRVNSRLIYLGTFGTKIEAAKAYDKAAKKYGVTRAKLNFTDRELTQRQEEVYRCLSPDFMNLSYKQAAMVLGIGIVTVWRELRKIKEACPSLFPMYPPPQKMVRYSEWMDDRIVEKF